ncbi:MAG: SIR2 family protein [Rhizobiales bacterium]|nr:SIR2 family protein [Hyphomicrobiales bacterium]
MVDLRQILSQGRKRVGLLIGAGAPTAIRIDDKGRLKDDGNPLIPDVARLTDAVVKSLPAADQQVITKLKTRPDEEPNIEAILTRVRRLAQAIGGEKVHGLDAIGYNTLAEGICQNIGSIVRACLPNEQTPYSELISWIGGTHRDHPVEIFTPNYDLLIEEAFERARLPYFDGFTGAHLPFFDPVSVSSDKLPARWSRLWKIHGSLGWDVHGDSIIRTGSRAATKLIYPDHLKYDEVTRQPYSALFERLRQFLTTPDTLLICTGFSFFDAHICAVLDETLAANTHTAIFAFQYRNLENESQAIKLALNRPNLSVYARDGAVIFGVPGQWQPGQPPTEDWESIRQTFWQGATSKDPAQFLLGDFAKLARFFSLTQASKMTPLLPPEPADTGASGPVSSPPAGGDHAKS